MADQPISRAAICKQCGTSFSYVVSRGADRIHCSAQCTSRAAQDRWKLKQKPGCKAPGCSKQAANFSPGLCQAHYARMRRNGHLGLAPQPDRLIDHSHGYKLLYAPQHPIGTDGQRTRVYEHRAVYYAEHGEGPFACNWCGANVTWSDMHVDHVDDDKTNNEPSNLVASCPTCNQQRGQWKMKRKIRDAMSMAVTWQGRTQSVCDWADEIGLSASALKQRLHAGWPLARAMTEPRGRFGPKARTA